MLGSALSISERVFEKSKQYANTEPNFSPMGKDVYERTYSRIKKDGKRESWLDTVSRVVEGNCKFVEERFIEPDEVEKLFDLLYNFKVIPAGRHLWSTGVPKRAFVSNCFAGETKVLTDKGWKRIADLAGSKANIVCGTGGWRESEFRSFGKQKLMKIEYCDGFTRGDNSDIITVYATPDHEWVVTTKNRAKPYKVKTKDLNLSKHLLVTQKPRNRNEYLSPQGIQHGIVYGDGSLRSHCGQGHTFDRSYESIICLYAKDQDTLDDLRKYFICNSGRSDDISYVNDCGDKIYGLFFGGMPIFYKSLPSIEESKQYLMGFLAGWIAADGTVRNSGTIELYCKDKQALEFARDAASICGIRTTNVRLARLESPFDGSEKPLYYITFYSCDNAKSLLIRRDHLFKHEQNHENDSYKYFYDTSRIISISESDREEEVYCAIVPDDHRFVIDGYVLTGNCWTAGWMFDDVSKHFTFTFARLMEGGGVGSNYSDKYFQEFPKPQRRVTLHVVCEESHKDYERMVKVPLWGNDPTPPLGNREPDRVISLLSTKYAQEWDGSLVVDDSREGWVEALQILIDSFFNTGIPLANGTNDLVIDVSRIRPEGARLKAFGGTASGPLPLVWMLHQVCNLLNESFTKGEDFNWRLAMCIDHEIARCVVSGNVRRSARMAMKHWRDQDVMEFITLKRDSHSHWSTNISVMVDNDFWKQVNRKNSHATKILETIIDGIILNGEPGICDITNCNKDEVTEFFSTNPCGEITLPEWGSCNLGHVNLKAFAYDYNGLLEAFRLMTRFLIRATFADYPDPLALETVNRDRRIGVGFTGFQNWLNMQGIRYSDFPSNESACKKLQRLKEKVRDEARKYCFKLRIPECIKVTTVAPTGTISKLTGVSEGIQPIYAPYYLRRVRYSMSDSDQAKRVEELQAKGHHVEDDVYVGSNTKVVTYVCKDQILDEISDPSIVEGSADITLQEFFAVQAAVQENYADNSISITVNFDRNKVTREDIVDSLKQFSPRLKGTTMMPLEHSFVQSPYESITKEQYDKLVEDQQISQMNSTGLLNCKNGVCEVPAKVADEDERIHTL